MQLRQTMQMWLIVFVHMLSSNLSKEVLTVYMPLEHQMIPKRYHTLCPIVPPDITLFFLHGRFVPQQVSYLPLCSCLYKLYINMHCRDTKFLHIPGILHLTLASLVAIQTILSSNTVTGPVGHCMRALSLPVQSTLVSWTGPVLWPNVVLKKLWAPGKGRMEWCMHITAANFSMLTISGISQLSADHSCIFVGPEVIAYFTPYTAMADLYSTLVWVPAT